MRGSRLAMIVLACAAVAACEDGPAQTYVPPAPSAGNTWNNGWDPGATPPAGTYDTATAGFTDEGTDVNILEPCSGAQVAAVDTELVKQPMMVNGAGGINMAGLNADGTCCSWSGMTIEQAVAQLCQAVSEGDYFGDGELDDGWGNGGILIAEYNVTNRFIDTFAINPGYEGVFEDPCLQPNRPNSLTACSLPAASDYNQGVCTPDGTTTFGIGVNHQLSITTGETNCKGGTTNPKLLLNWGDGATNTLFDQMYRALMNAYGSILLPSGFPTSSTPCYETGACIPSAFGEESSFYIPALGFALVFGPANAPQPVPSVPTQVQLYFAKEMPYSFANPLLTMSQTGAYANGATLAPNCTIGFGVTYADFLTNCVNVDTTQAEDALEVKKLLEGLTHDDQTYSFNLQGVDTSFVAQNLTPTQVVQDNVPPQPGDLSDYLNVDQSTNGNIANDFDPTGMYYDLHGTGDVMYEYGLLVKTRLRTLAFIDPSTVDESQCIFPNPQPAGFDAASFIANLPSYCTGFEGLITPFPPQSANDLVNLGNPAFIQMYGANVAAFPPFPYGSGLHPGVPSAEWCFDPTGYANAESLALGQPAPGFQYCYPPTDNLGNNLASSPTLFALSNAQVQQVFGKGELAAVPVEGQGNRFYFQQYGDALLKYMMAPDTTDPGQLIDDVPIEYQDLYFDSLGAGQFEDMEYVDRRFTTQNGEPTDVVLTADIRDGIFNSYDFSRVMYRGELAMYSTLTDTTSGPPATLGSGEALMSNIFGSPVVQGAVAAGFWTDPTGMHTPYDCATALWNDGSECAHGPPTNPPGFVSANCGGVSNPNNFQLNDDCVPIMTPYQPLLNEQPSVFALGSNNLMRVVQEFQDTQEAQFFIPLYQNPWDPTSGAPADGTVFAPATFGGGLTVAGGGITAMVPWAPQQPGIGFSIPVNGVSYKFVQTSQADFGGTTITAELDYNMVTCTPPTEGTGPGTCATGQLCTPYTGPSPTYQGQSVCAEPTTKQPYMDLLGLESGDFLGDVFLCQDPLTGDMLTAHMYTNVDTMTTWMAAHPSAFDSCGIIVSYSPFDNYADWITSLNNGVAVDVTQGGGGGRVVGVTLFVPGQ